MRFLQALALICGLVAPAAASQYFNTPTPSTATGTAWSSQAGQFYLAASSANVSTTTALVPTKSTWTITLDGAKGAINALGVTATYGISAGTFTGNGAALTNVTAATNANLTGPVTSVGNATSIPGPVPVSAIDLSTVAAKITPSLEFISSPTVTFVSGALPAATYSVGVAPLNAAGAEGRLQAAAQSSYVLDGSHGMSVSWPAITGAVSYRVYISTSGDYQRFFPAAASPLTVNTATQVGIDPSTLSVSSATSGGTLAGENWYFTVSAVFADGGMTQDGINLGQAKNIRTYQSGGTVTVSWSAVGAATSYRLYVGTDQNGGGPRMHTCYTVVSGTSKTLTGAETYVCGAAALPYGNSDNDWSGSILAGSINSISNASSFFAADIKVYPGPQSDAGLHLIRYNAKGAAAKVTYGQSNPVTEYFAEGLFDTDGGNPSDPQRYLFRNQNGTVIWSAPSTNGTNPGSMTIGSGIVPGSTLTVYGTSQFGTTSPSSFTTTGALTIGSADNTILLASNGSHNPFTFLNNNSAGDSNAQSGSPILGLGSHNNVAMTTVGNVAVGASVTPSTLTVAGSAQFGQTAVSSFTLAGALNMASGAAINTSGANGNIVSQASMTTTGGFFGDGSHLTGVMSSSGTLASGYTTTQSAFLTCITASTRTIVSPTAGTALITFSGTASNGTGTNGSGASFLVNGGYAQGLNSTSDQAEDVSPVGGNAYNVGYSIQIYVSAGTNNFCATLRSVGGSTTVTYNGGAFGVTLIHN